MIELLPIILISIIVLWCAMPFIRAMFILMVCGMVFVQIEALRFIVYLDGKK